MEKYLADEVAELGAQFVEREKSLGLAIREVTDDLKKRELCDIVKPKLGSNLLRSE